MTINWDKITDNTAVWCKTMADAQAFLEAAEKRGAEWRAGDTLTSKTNWTYYKDRTCYNIASSNKLYFGKQSHYIDCGYTVVDYRDLLVKPRICEVLGVEVGEQFELAGFSPDVWFSILPDGTYETAPSMCKGSAAALFRAIENPAEVIRKTKFEEIELAPKKRLYPNVTRIEGKTIRYTRSILISRYDAWLSDITVTIDEILGESPSHQSPSVTASPQEEAKEKHTPTFGDLSEADSRELIVRWNIFSGNDCDDDIEACHRPGAECDKCRLGEGDGDEFLTCSDYVRAYPREALEILRGMECGNAKAER